MTNISEVDVEEFGGWLAGLKDMVHDGELDNDGREILEKVITEYHDRIESKIE